MRDVVVTGRSRWYTGAVLSLILACALALRLYGLSSWDGTYLFHPDERQILLVVDDLSFPWPPDWPLLFSPQSPWNPGFFAYGSLPIYLLRIVASLAGLFNPDLATINSSFIVGRALSVAFDVGTVYLIYHLGRKLYDARVGLLASALVACTVLHIQLAHFYTVDTVLTFFVVLTVLAGVGLVRGPNIGRGALMGVAWGLALATKMSAIPLLLPAMFAWLLGLLAREQGASAAWSNPRTGLKIWGLAIAGCAWTGLVALLVFLICEPYALIDVVTFLIDVIHESRMARGGLDIPYTRQFVGTLPYIYPIWQATKWSLGLPLGLAGFSASVAALVQVIRQVAKSEWRRAGELGVPLTWVALYFGLTGSFHAKFLRYMLPVIPFICLWAAWALLSLATAVGKLRRTLGRVGLAVVVTGTAIYALAYMNVYREEHPWIQATTWLCRNLPPYSTIVIEHWDDPLPLLQGLGELDCSGNHLFTTLKVYDPDDTRKLESILDALEQNDYIILSSNRLYNTIPRLPKRYPLTSRYYELLMGERLGFELIYYTAVYPKFLGISLVDDTFSDPRLPRPRLLAEKESKQPGLNLGRADESFTVYDHPKPLVFKKTRQLSRQEILALFGDAAQNLPPPKAQK